MDIVELSRKMEADLLESHTSGSTCKKSLPNHSFSPRLTRSRTSSGKETPIVEKDVINLEPKRNQKKVDEVEKIYLNKKAKVVHKNLETIYEDPVWKKGSTIFLGTSKVKRSIYLDREFRITSKQKSKLRKMKIKRLGKKKIKPFRMSDDEFKSRMLSIDHYINENEVEIGCRSEGCDVDFDANNCNKHLNGLRNSSEESNIEESKESDGVYNGFIICE